MHKFCKINCLLAFLLMIIFAAQAQVLKVGGKVISSETNIPLVGVSVLNQSTGKTTVTNNFGRFSIDAGKGHTILFTSIGFENYKVNISTQNELSITLKATSTKLDEVVVTAYGIQRKKNSLGNSIQSISGSDIAQTKRENLVNSLAGKIAGATITATSGAPGASAQIVLRGATSIFGNNQPLFIVDGVPYNNQGISQEELVGGQSIAFNNRNSDYGNRAMDLNPEDIETVTILKGPEAAALYGSDGTAGAIIVTTKKGKIGEPVINYSNAFRVDKLYLFPEVQNTYGIGNNGISDSTAIVNPFLILGSTAGAGVPGAFGPKIPANDTIFDNTKAFFRQGFKQQHDISIDGGSNIATFRLTAGWFQQTGAIPNTGLKRFTTKLSGSTKLKSLNISTSFAYVNSTTDKATKGVGGYLLNLLTWPVQNDAADYINADGTRKTYRAISNFALEYDNPFWEVNKNPQQDKMDRVTANFNVSKKIASLLTLTNITGLDYYTMTGFLITHPLSRFGAASNGFYSQFSKTYKNLSNTTRLGIEKKIGSIINTLNAGVYLEDEYYNNTTQKGERFYERDFVSINNTDPLSRAPFTTISNIRKVRFFGSYEFNYQDILYLTFAGTREGNSTFNSRKVKKNPFYNYGSGSLSFLLSNIASVKENFSWANKAKLRLSYASSGKGPHLPYVIDPRFAQASTTGGGFAYDITGNNFDLKPEYTENLEFGAEFGILSDRITLDIAFYKNNTINQLLYARTSYGTGFVQKWLNGGETENKGMEIQLAIKPIETKNFKWRTLINFDKNDGVVKSLPANLPTFYDSDTWVFGNVRSQYFAGAKIGNLAGNTLRRNDKGQLLINPSTGLPYNDAEYKTIGDRQPDFKMGFVSQLSYKDFSLSFTLDLRKGGDVFNATEYFLYLTGYSLKTLNREQPVVIKGVLLDGLENSAKPTENAIAIKPLTNSTFYSATTNHAEEDFIENVNWLRLRDVTLSYQLNKKILKKLIRSASVYVTATDLFMITNYTGADPSVNANNSANKGFGGAGIDFGSISTPRGLNFGLSLGF